MVKGVESVDQLATERTLHMVANHITQMKYSDRKMALALGIERRNLRERCRRNIQLKQFNSVSFVHN